MSGAGRLLIVEDDPAMRRAIERVLSSLCATA